ncbi:MAG: radical SAM protein [Nitrososphaerota archaeon]|jgi:MoaA/NifB/PqqE/SkfB family radical SAM enzyme|nr:radical SAM protein [Nitrososphaerota archaeon]
MVFIPRFLTFFVTNKCNATCSHCFNWKNPSIDELSFEEILKIDFSVFESVSLTGGEPTLRTDLADICYFIASAKSRVYLNSNGLMPKRLEEVIEKTGAARVNVTVSLDGTQELHNQIRGVKCFDTALKTIQLCKKLGVNINILTTISRLNISNISLFIKHLKTERLFTKKGDVIFNIARGLEHTFNLDTSISFPHNPRDNYTVLTPDELKTVYTQIKPYMTNQNRIVWEHSLKILTQHKKTVSCYAGNLDIVLHANGDIAACEYTKPFANIKNYNYNIINMWNSQSAQTIRNKINKCYCIHPCNLNTAIPRTLTGIFKLAPDIAKNKANKLKNKL